LTRGELLHLALMSSENRAAHALGRNYPGGIPAFVRAMNEKAQSLGMTASHFVEPTGLSSDNVASPEDLSRLVMAAAQNPTIRDFSTDTEHSVRIGRHMVEFHNTDALTRNPGWDIIVQKTGYITAAGRCLVMQAVIGGRDVVIVLLNSFGKYTRVADAVRVRKWVEERMSEHTAHVAVSSNS
jgi:serine-type D-Ala-D-Ala endopeptidase (penicillin-binding protein 7)